MDEKKSYSKFQIRGRVIGIGEEMTFASGFCKREVVVECSDKEQFPDPVKVTMKKERCEMAAGLGEGDIVEIEGFIEGRKWDGGDKGIRYFTDLACMSCLVVEKAQKPTAAVDWETLVILTKAWGGDEEEAKKACMDFVAANGIKQRTQTKGKMMESEFQKVADKIMAAHGGADELDEVIGEGREGDSDEMPF